MNNQAKIDLWFIMDQDFGVRQFGLCSQDIVGLSVRHYLMVKDSEYENAYSASNVTPQVIKRAYSAKIKTELSILFEFISYEIVLSQEEMHLQFDDSIFGYDPTDASMYFNIAAVMWANRAIYCDSCVAAPL